MEDVEDVLLNEANPIDISNASGYPIAFGYTSGGTYLAVVFELVDDAPETLRPITAFEVPERERP
ncbi:MAG: hypothetical protein DWQ42_13700 [Planctomycetota bacterium]|nr:MAG: hypothetical protein DWQ42_13700 [Planctomycetota bacterium]REK39338.1 MAG: hypothetical protein DWQ46_18855 [Planctomycetota bacterium]